MFKDKKNKVPLNIYGDQAFPDDQGWDPIIPKFVGIPGGKEREMRMVRGESQDSHSSPGMNTQNSWFCN